MSLTHHKGLSLTPDPRGTTALEVTGTILLHGAITATTSGAQTKLTKLNVSGTTVLSGNVTATASGKSVKATKIFVSGTSVLSGVVTATAAGKQTSLTKLAVSGTSVLSGNVTATAAGKSVKTTTLYASGTTVLSGNVTATGSTKKVSVNELVVASMANGACGIKTIAAASSGIGVISSTKIVATSRIFVTPQAAAAYTFCGVRAVGTGTASLYLNQFNATAATLSGKVAWWVVNL